MAPSLIRHLGLLLTLALLPWGARAFDAQKALAISQEALGRQVGDHTFVDGKGRTLSLRDFRGKPLLLSFVYTSCYHTCSAFTNYLAEVVEMAQGVLGEGSFAVLTVGFDAPADTPERMRHFARSRGIDLPGWSFVSGDAATVKAITREVGFVYEPSPKGFDHMLQVTVLDGEGRVYRQVYGADFPPPQLIEPLKELVWGTKASSLSPAGWLDNLRLFCTVYDPASGRYRFDYSFFAMILGGALSLAGILAFTIHAWRTSA
ncbi:MAG: SCO family protein [Gammaproteobacteria bacterium]|nr:MAG: SCO family protein [Gammaproteobacteria bacterium]